MQKELWPVPETKKVSVKMDLWLRGVEGTWYQHFVRASARDRWEMLTALDTPTRDRISFSEPQEVLGE